MKCISCVSCFGLWFLLLFEIKQFWNHPQIFCVFQLHLSKLETAREDDINLEIHNVQCIYNALSDIKAEVENVIKVGRKIVETDEASHQVGVTHSFSILAFLDVSKKTSGGCEKMPIFTIAFFTRSR